MARINYRIECNKLLERLEKQNPDYKGLRVHTYEGSYRLNAQGDYFNGGKWKPTGPLMLAYVEGLLGI